MTFSSLVDELTVSIRIVIINFRNAKLLDNLIVCESVFENFCILAIAFAISVMY